MSKKSKNKGKKRLLDDNYSIDFINLGDIEAEKDKNLSAYFVKSLIYDRAKELNDPVSILVGERGTGKSAILEKIKSEKSDKNIVRISNNDLGVLLAQKYLNEYFTEESFKEKRLAFKFLWLFIICASVLKKIFSNKNLLDKIATQHFDSNFKELNEFFKITKNDTPLKFSITASAKIAAKSGPLSLDVNIGTQQIQKDIQKASELNDLIRFISEFIDNLNQYIDGEMYLLIDDLDSNSDYSEFSKLYIEGLVEAIYSINRKSNLKVIATLLESVLNSIKLPNIRGKIVDNYAKYLRWNSETCNELISKRFSHYNLKLSDIFVSDIKFSDIYKHTTGTPRDIIRLFQSCLEIYSTKKQRLNKHDLNKILHGFSKFKLQELLEDSLEQQYIDLSPIITELQAGKRIYSYNELSQILDNLCFRHLENGDHSNKKLDYLFNYAGENVKSLIFILYQRGFIGYNKHQSRSTAVFFNEDPDHIINTELNYMIRDAYIPALSIK